MTDEELIGKLKYLLDKDNGPGMSIYRLSDYCLCDYTYIKRICKRELPLAQKTRELITDGLVRLSKEFMEKVMSGLDI